MSTTYGLNVTSKPREGASYELKVVATPGFESWASTVEIQHTALRSLHNGVSNCGGRQ